VSSALRDVLMLREVADGSGFSCDATLVGHARPVPRVRRPAVARTRHEKPRATCARQLLWKIDGRGRR
jgi:hypothetical protein